MALSLNNLKHLKIEGNRNGPTSFRVRHITPILTILFAQKQGLILIIRWL